MKRRKIGTLQTPPPITPSTPSLPPLSYKQGQAMKREMIRQTPQYGEIHRSMGNPFMPSRPSGPEYLSTAMEQKGVPYMDTMSRVAPAKVPEITTALTAPQMAGYGLEQQRLATEAIPQEAQRIQETHESQMKSAELDQRKQEADLLYQESMRPDLTNAERQRLKQEADLRQIDIELGQKGVENYVPPLTPQEKMGMRLYEKGVGEYLPEVKQAGSELIGGQAPAITSTTMPKITTGNQDILMQRAGLALMQTGLNPETLEEEMSTPFLNTPYSNKDLGVFIQKVRTAIQSSDPSTAEAIKMMIRSNPGYETLKRSIRFGPMDLLKGTPATITNRFGPSGLSHANQIKELVDLIG